MIVIQTKYVSVPQGLQDVIVEREVRPTPEVADNLKATIQAWLKKDVEPIRVFPGGHANIAERETIELTTTVDKKTHRRKHDRRPRPIAITDVAAVKLRRESAEDDESDLFVRVVLGSGNKFDLPYTVKKKSRGRGKSKPKKPTDEGGEE